MFTVSASRLFPVVRAYSREITISADGFSFLPIKKKLSTFPSAAMAGSEADFFLIGISA